MYKKFKNIARFFKKLNNPVMDDMEPYNKMLARINEISFAAASDYELKETSMRLREQIIKGCNKGQLLEEAFALVREAAKRVVGMYPFDVQVIAGIALDQGSLVEMKTGEGKTLAAVMPVYLNALEGKGVHVLTFNDYLAERDAGWMGPIYEFLGLTVGYIKEGMGLPERKSAYCCDVTYLTAKEAGFDYLRDFLCTDKAALVQRPFNYAIIDEADSILIDEARIPLVIAGISNDKEGSAQLLCSIVKSLRGGKDYETDQHDRNVSLTDEGLQRVEQILGCGNLYENENLDLLTRLNCALHAEILLKRDRDYIVRNDKIELVDEFTGRVAEKRHWPDNLHSAVEAKEGLSFKDKGIIMGSVALQHFLSLYPRISGMTGTAEAEASEFRKFYCMDVVVIPTNKPCIRKDNPDMIFTHAEAKKAAIISDIEEKHKTGRPVLIGTGSVEESEELAYCLRWKGIPCVVLNARNDEMEAHIIAEAGKPGAVTVSTNMAGRGVDIKLGGGNEQYREEVIALGGLYVVGTGLHESRRVDDQLKGRAGRQGEPGESRFYVSFEDDLLKKFDVAKLLPGKRIPKRQDAQIDDVHIIYAVEKCKKAVEGYNSDVRAQLWKYSFILEQQRRIIHKKRQDVLLEVILPERLEKLAPERYAELCSQHGIRAVNLAEKQLFIYFVNKLWAEHLDYVSYIREGIHLVIIGNKDPLTEFNKLAIEAFERMLEKLDYEIVKAFESAVITDNGIDMDREGLKGPSATWTYLINDSLGLYAKMPLVVKFVSQFVS